MDVFSSQKTPRMLTSRKDGACPFCITQLHEEALVCCGCGAHKWHNSNVIRFSWQMLLFKFCLPIFVIGLSIFAPSLLEQIETVRISAQDEYISTIRAVLKWSLIAFIVFFWVALVVHIEELIRAIRNPVNGTVWRRKRWG